MNRDSFLGGFIADCYTGPDCTKCIKEFETVLDTTTSNTAHHEEASAL